MNQMGIAQRPPPSHMPRPKRKPPVSIDDYETGSGWWMYALLVLFLLGFGTIIFMVGYAAGMRYPG